MNQDVKDILKTLKEIRMDWVADQVEDTIREGKKVEKPYREPGKRKTLQGTASEPYSEKEELGICLRTLQTYFVDLSDIWDKTQINLNAGPETYHSESVAVKIIDEDGQLMQPFLPDFYKVKDSLKRMLSSIIDQIEP